MLLRLLLAAAVRAFLPLQERWDSEALPAPQALAVDFVVEDNPIVPAVAAARTVLAVPTADVVARTVLGGPSGDTAAALAVDFPTVAVVAIVLVRYGSIQTTRCVCAWYYLLHWAKVSGSAMIRKAVQILAEAGKTGSPGDLRGVGCLDVGQT